MQLQSPVLDDAPDQARRAASPALIAVPAATLGVNSSLHVDLYIYPDAHAPPVLFRSRDLPVTAEDIERLLRDSTVTVYIAPKDYSAYQQYLRTNLQKVVKDKSRPLNTRVQFLGEVARETLRSAMLAGSDARMLYETNEIAEPLVELVREPSLISADMYSVLRHDLSMFSHAFNVSAYCLQIARIQGMDDITTLRQLATAALLHDVGKLRVPTAVLNKKGPLSRAEKRLVDRHPQYAFERLCRRPEITWDQLMLVYQHHERLDGSGYPVGLCGNELHLWARICAVANAFDSATRILPYRPALHPSKALEQLARAAGRTLDEEIVSCFQQIQSNKSSSKRS